MAVVGKNVSKNEQVTMMIDKLVERANHSLTKMRLLDQEEIDRIVREMALAGLDQHMPLAKLAIEETGRGVYEDKIIKNMFATEYIYHNIKYNKTVGVISESKQEGMVDIAEPIGVICGITPVTNPTSTTMFKALISIKTGNPIIFAFHPSAQKSSSQAAQVLYDAAVKAGAPEGCIQWIEKPSIDATQQLMHHDRISLILATGGSVMVKSAYSSSKQALEIG